MSAAWTTQSQAIEFEDAFEVSEEHLHLLSLPARLFICWGCGDAPRFVTCGFMDAAHDFARLRIRATSIFHRTAVTVHLARSVDDGVGFRDVRAGIPEWAPVAAERVPRRTSIFVGLFIPDKVVSGERIVFARCFVPD
jgi:hypothetical protein